MAPPGPSGLDSRAEVSGSGGAPVPVVFIGGRHRSGTTLLELMLGQIPGFVPAGEVRQLWTLGVERNRPCGCAARFHDCEFWGAVGDRAFGGWRSREVGDLVRLRRRLDHPLSAPRLIAGASGGAARHYAAGLARLYEAIRTVSSADVVIDSSKSVPHASILRAADGIDVGVLHLVRDSRGVAFSGERGAGKSAPAVRRPRGLERRSPTLTALQWLFYNAVTPVLRRDGTPYVRIRYEDLVRAPDRSLRHVVERLRPQSADALPDLGGTMLRLGTNHLVYGNRLRFHRGDLELRLDDEWRRAMSPASRRWVTALTLPLLKRYGYPIAL